MKYIPTWTLMLWVVITTIIFFIAWGFAGGFRNMFYVFENEGVIPILISGLFWVSLVLSYLLFIYRLAEIAFSLLRRT